MELAPWQDIRLVVILIPSAAAPVRRTIDTEAEIVGILLRLFRGLVLIETSLPQGIDGVFVVLENTCGQAVSYEINGPRRIWHW
jgi:hypothetical protein